MSAAIIDPNLLHQERTVSWEKSIPCSKSRSSTFRKLNGKRTYIITTIRMTSGDEFKRLKGLSGLRRLGIKKRPTLAPSNQDSILMLLALILARALLSTSLTQRPSRSNLGKENGPVWPSQQAEACPLSSLLVPLDPMDKEKGFRST